jgi:hypothetical protein
MLLRRRSCQRRRAGDRSEHVEDLGLKYFEIPRCRYMQLLTRSEAVALLMSANTLWCSVVILNNIEGSGKLSVYMMQELQLAYDYGGKGSEGLSYTSQLCVLVGSTMDKSEKVICKLLAL